MRVGHDENYLSVRSEGALGGNATLHIETLAVAGDARFSASGVVTALDASDEAMKRFADFEEFRTMQIEITLSAGSWIRLERDLRGYIRIRYRVGSWRSSAVMEGEVDVEGEFAVSFCQEFRALYTRAGASA